MEWWSYGVMLKPEELPYYILLPITPALQYSEISLTITPWIEQLTRTTPRVEDLIC